MNVPPGNDEPVAIAAASEVAPGRYPELDLLARYRAALSRLLSEWSLRPADINGVIASPAGMAEGKAENIFVHEQLCELLGVHPPYAETMNAGGATHALMLTRAALAIRAGLTDSVLCVAAGRFPKVGDGGAEANARMCCHPQFDFLYGPYIPPLYAQAATRHMHEFGTTREDLAAVAVSSRAWALRHPDAFMRRHGAITVEDVIASRPIASPFHLLDCSVPLDGGAAYLVANADVARRLNPRPAWLLGYGEAHTHFNISQSHDLLMGGADAAGRRAFAMAGMTPSEIDVFELYDSFSYNPLATAEALGVVPRGRGGRLFADGRTAPGGDRPVNTYGGLLSFGHTGDASGMSMVVEGALQIMGRAGERQVTGAQTALVYANGGMMSEHAVVILGSRP